MRTLPPPAREAPPLRTVDVSGPWRFMWWLVRGKASMAAVVGIIGALWMLPSAALPLVVGWAIDAGIGPKGDVGALLGWVAAVVGLAVVQAVGAGLLFHTGGGLWIHAAAATQRVVGRHVAGLGASLRSQVSAGEVVAVTANDIHSLGGALEVFGRLIGSVLSFVLVVVVLLANSPVLGLVMLIGVPVAALGIGPFVKPLEKRRERQREMAGETTKLAADIVSGLRILRGIGGEGRFVARFVTSSQEVRKAGVAAGRVESLLSAVEILLPGLVTILVVWLGARFAMSGQITVGELIAFYGASAYLVIPISTCTEGLHAISSAVVAGRRVCRILRLTPNLPEAAEPRALPTGAFALYDETTGVAATAGRLTVVDAPALFGALADRLARYADPADGAAVLAGEGDSQVPLAAAELTELRRRVLLAHNQDMLFSGPLRAELTGYDPTMPGAGWTETALTKIDVGALTEVLYAADALDVIESLPAGLDEVVTERGRSLSGGQRQRLLLARALLADPDVLILDQPTSAVDAHTEARIAERVARRRAGRTTVVLTESPLWKAAADEIVTAADLVAIDDERTLEQAR